MPLCNDCANALVCLYHVLLLPKNNFRVENFSNCCHLLHFEVCVQLFAYGKVWKISISLSFIRIRRFYKCSPGGNRGVCECLIKFCSSCASKSDASTNEKWRGTCVKNVVFVHMKVHMLPQCHLPALSLSLPLSRCQSLEQWSHFFVAFALHSRLIAKISEVILLSLLIEFYLLLVFIIIFVVVVVVVVVRLQKAIAIHCGKSEKKGH